MILCLVIVLVLPASMPAYGWDDIVAFGDSLSDNGTDDGYGLCLASNGPVWLDYLAESMRDVELEDLALCGARTDGPIVPDPDGINIGLKQQVSNYIDSLPPDADLSGILYTVWIGGTDLLARGPAEPVVTAAIINIDEALQALVLAGAEDILVMTLPDLGLAPAILYTPYAEAYTTASMAFNTDLTQLVCEFRGLFPQVKFYMADTFELLQYAVENGESLGFTNVDGTCVAGGAFQTCEGYLFFDGIHPTTATHAYLAALAVGQVKKGYVSKEIKALLKKLNPIHPRKPFVVQCEN
jgi:phospholipase/lecithinase/hemolysin